MKRLFTIGISLSLMLSPIPVLSHEGHDHGPSTVEAPKGGMMRSLETIHLELVTEKNTMRIYVYDKDLKPKAVKDVPVKASITLPRKKPEPIKLQDKGEYWEIQHEGPKAHRLTLVLIVHQAGHDDKVEFTVER